MTRKKVELDDIVGLVKTDEPTDSVELKKEAYVIPDKMVEISEGLLEDIRHTLVSLSGLKAFDKLGEEVDNGRFTTVVPNEDLINLDFKDIIGKIDEVLDEL